MQMETEPLNVACDNAAITNRTEFMDMNDDCLLHIFKKLPPHNLYAIASTCIRLQALARTTFNSKINNQYLDLAMMVKEHLPYPKNYIDNFLRTFGDLIKEIDFNVDNMPLRYQLANSEMFISLAAYCGGGRLEKLRLINIALSSEQIFKASKLLCGLKTIHLNNSNRRNQCDMIALISECDELVVHPYCSDQSIAPVLRSACNFPNLEKLSITIGEDDFDRIECFLGRHQRLKFLKLKFDVYRRREVNVFNLEAVGHCKLLEFLDVDGYSITLVGMPLKSAVDLPHLKYLKIANHNTAMGVEHFLNAAASSSLQHLDISIAVLLDSNLLQRTDAFRNLRTLCVIDLADYANADRLFQLNNLKVLTKFELLDGYAMQSSVTIYLNNLGSIDTLTALTLSGGTFDNFTIEGLVRFTNLRELRLIEMELRNIAETISNVHWTMLQRIDKLMTFEFTSYSVLPFIVKFLQHLGSIDSLECLLFNVREDLNDECAAAIGRFQNLRILAIQTVTSTSTVGIFLKLVKQFEKLEQLKLQNSVVDWKRLINLIETMPRLCIIKCANWINLRAYNNLIEIGQRLNKKLIIEFPTDLRELDFSFDLIEKNRHIVDICYKKKASFNEFEY